MVFEWDEAKRLANLEKHGIDFEVASTIWDGLVLDPATVRKVGNELRLLALGIPTEHETIIAVVYTDRGENRRIISAGAARRHERKNYHETFGRSR